MMQATGMVNDHLADCVVRTTVTTVGRSRRSASRAAGASSSA
jgi:hypothetical protein